jgi:hypothetical protein
MACAGWASQDFKPDVVVSDSLDPCGSILADKLQAPVVRVHNGAFMETVLDSWNPWNPVRFNLVNPLAYVPQAGLGGHHRPLVSPWGPFGPLTANGWDC